MEVENLILVVIYNKKAQKSSTLNSLLSCFDGNANILIFNNGPAYLDRTESIFGSLQEKYNKVSIEEDLSNRPLSVLYNRVIEENEGYKRYFIFDDDTLIPAKYFSETIIAAVDNDLVIPVIISISDKSVCYPLVDGEPTSTAGTIDITKRVFSIGSGLLINKSLIDVFLDNNIRLFDERYALYGVDFSLFRRIQHLIQNGHKINISIAGMLEHSLSKKQKHKEKWRKREITIDQALTSRFYTRSKLSIIFIVMKKVLKFDFENAILAIKTFKSGYHQRSAKYL